MVECRTLWSVALITLLATVSLLAISPADAQVKMTDPCDSCEDDGSDDPIEAVAECTDQANWMTDNYWGSISDPWGSNANLAISEECEEAVESIGDSIQKAKAGAGERFEGQHTRSQPDGSRNMLGDIYEAVYLAWRESTQLERIIDDPDQDGLSNYREFQWGTIPVTQTTVVIEGEDTTVSLDWGDDTDNDGLGDQGEVTYWNDFHENQTMPELAKQAEQSLVNGRAVRDQDSLLDPDKDSCFVEGIEAEPFEPKSAGSELWRFTRCNLVADDPDSDNDGLLDGQEIASPDMNSKNAKRRSIGQYESVCESNECNNQAVEWLAGAFAWAPDSDCQLTKRNIQIEDQSREVFCYETGNYHNTTDEAHEWYVPYLNPGYGDGLDDRTERDWFEGFADTDRWADDLAAHYGDWGLTADGDDLDQAGRELEPYEIDFDGDGALPLHDRDSDDDGYTDFQERLTHPNASKWPYADENRSAPPAPSCGDHDVVMLPYLNDTDHDGLQDRIECEETGTDPSNWDSDGDGMPDGWEVYAGIDPLIANANINADADEQDGNALTNIEEYCYRPPSDPANDRDDDQEWGCSENGGQDMDGDGTVDYLAWNPCALDPADLDTDQDDLTDVEEAYGMNPLEHKTNAASENDLTGECTLKTGQGLDTYSSTEPAPAAIWGEGSDLPDGAWSEEEATFTGDTWDETQAATEEGVTPVELARESAERASKIAQKEVDRIDTLLRALTPWTESTIDRTGQFVETVDNLVPPKRILSNTGPAASSTISMVQRLDPGDALPQTGLADTLLEQDVTTAAAQDTLEDTLASTSDVTDSLAQVSASELVSGLATRKEAPLSEPDPNAAAGTVSAPDVLDSEGVIPDFTFSLLHTLDKAGVVDGTEDVDKTVWDTYIQAGGNDLVDQSHFKLFAVLENGTSRASDNVPFNQWTAWDVDDDDTTGANSPCVRCTHDATWEIGDDVIATVEADGSLSNDVILRPAFKMELLDPSDPAPFFLSAFVIAQMDGSDFSDALTGEDSNLDGAGYVAYTGLDGTSQAAAPTGQIDGFDADRSFEITGLPHEATLRLEDYGLFLDSASSLADSEVDPANTLTVSGSLVPVPDGTIARHDAQVAAGIAEYQVIEEDNGTVKRMLPKGNHTKASLLFRGIPDAFTMDHQLLQFENETAGTIEREDQTLDLDASHSGPDDGIEVSIARTSNYNGTRPATEIGVVTSQTPSVTITKTTTRNASSRQDATDLLHPSGTRIDDAYLRVTRWDDLKERQIQEAETPDEATRLWAEDLDGSLHARSNTTERTNHVWSKQGVSIARYIDGPKNTPCPNLGAITENHYASLPPTESTDDGCLQLQIHELKDLAVDPRPTTAGSALSIGLERSQDEANRTQDRAFFWLDGPSWLKTTLTDLPETLDLDLRQGEDPTAAGDLTFSHAYTTSASSTPGLVVEGLLGDPLAEGSQADLKIDIGSLPASSTIDLSPSNRSMIIGFGGETAKSVDLRYSQTGQRLDIDGPRVAMARTDTGTDGTANIAEVDLPEVTSLVLDAASPGTFSQESDITSSQGATFYIERPAGASNENPDAFALSIDDLDGPSSLTLNGNAGGTWLLEGAVSDDASTVTLTGDLQDRNYNVSISDDPQTFSLKQTKSGDQLIGTGQELAVTASNRDQTGDAVPATFTGRIVDIVDGTDATAPAAPAWADAHYMTKTASDGTATTSFDIGPIASATLSSTVQGSEDAWERTVDIDAASQTGDLLFLAEDASDNLDRVYTAARPFGGTLDWTLTRENAHLDPAASTGTLEIQVDDADDNIAIRAHLTAAPDTFDLTWPGTQIRQPWVNATHDTQPSVTDPTVSLEVLDESITDPTYVLLNATELPASTQAHWDPVLESLNLELEDTTGTSNAAKTLDLRYNPNAASADVPTEGGSIWESFATATMNDQESQFAIRAGEIRSLTADVNKLSATKSTRFAIDHDDSSPFRLAIDTADVGAKLELATLDGTSTTEPTTLTLNANKTNSRLADLDLRWNSGNTIDAGTLDLLSQGEDHLFLELDGFETLDTTVTPSNVRAATSPSGTIDLQYGPATDVGSAFKAPEASDSHFLLWDETTLENAGLASSETTTLLRVRADSAHLIEVDTEEARFELSTATGGEENPVEAYLAREKTQGQITSGTAGAGWKATWPTIIPTDGERFRFTDTDTTDETRNVDADLLYEATENDQATWFDLEASLTDLTGDAVLRWTDALGEVDLEGAEAGTADVLITERPSKDQSAQVKTIADGEEGIIWIHHPSLGDDQGTVGLAESMREFALQLDHLEDLTVRADAIEADSSTREGRLGAWLNRTAPQDTASAATLFLANPAALATLELDGANDPLPEDLQPARWTYSTVEDLAAGTISRSANVSLVADDGSGELRSGEAYLRTISEDSGSRETNRTWTLPFTDIGQRLMVDARFKRDGVDTDTPTGTDTVTITTDALGDKGTTPPSDPDLTDLRIEEGNFTAIGTFEQLTRRLDVTFSADREVGGLDTLGTGTVGSADVVVKDGDGSYEALDTEGLVASSQEGGSAGWGHLTKIAEATWALTGDGLTAGSGTIDLVHEDPGKTLGLGVATLPTPTDANGDNTTTAVDERDFLVVEIDQLPTDWHVGLTREADRITLATTTSSTTPTTQAQWGRGPTPEDLAEFWTFDIDDLPEGNTTLTAKTRGEYELSWDTETPLSTTRIEGNATLGTGVVDLRMEDLPSEFTISTQDAFLTGTVTVPDPTESIGKLDVFRGECASQDDEDRCEGPPERIERSDASADIGADLADYDIILLADRERTSQPVFVYATGLTDSGWSVGEEVTNGSSGPVLKDDWKALKVSHDRSAPADVLVNLLGLGQNDTSLEARVTNVEDSFEFLFHPSLDLHPDNSTATPPDGFQTRTPLDVQDLYLELEHGNTGQPPVPWISVEDAQQSVVLNEVTDLSSGYAKFTAEGPGKVGYGGTTAFDEAGTDMNLQWKREAGGSGAMPPAYVSLGVTDLPKQAEIDAWAMENWRSAGCSVFDIDSACDAMLGVEASNGATFGAVDAVMNIDTSETTRVRTDDLTLSTPDGIAITKAPGAGTTVSLGDQILSQTRSLGPVHELRTQLDGLTDAAKIDHTFRTPQDRANASVELLEAPDGSDVIDRFVILQDMDVTDGSMQLTAERSGTSPTDQPHFSVTAAPASSVTDPDVDPTAVVAGSVPMPLFGHNVETFDVRLQRLTESAEVRTDAAASTGRGVQVEAGDLVDAEIGFELAQPSGGTSSNVGDCSQYQGPFTLAINRETTGVVDEMAFFAYTPNPSVTVDDKSDPDNDREHNWIFIDGSTVDETEPLSVHSVLTDVQTADLSVSALSGGTCKTLDLGSEFAYTHGVARRFDTVYDAAAETGHLTTETLPDQVRIQQDGTEFDWIGSDIDLRLWGRAGTLAVNCGVDIWMEDCWEVASYVPGAQGNCVFEPEFDLETEPTRVAGTEFMSATFSDFQTHSFLYEAGISTLEFGAKSAGLSGVGGLAVGAAYALYCGYTAADETEAGELLIDINQLNSREEKVCRILYDLDGTSIQEWRGTPFSIECPGDLELKHEAHRSSMALEASSDDPGAFEDTTLGLKKIYDEEGRVIDKVWQRQGWQTYCDASGGSPPQIDIRTKDRRVSVPSTLWEC